jgi:oligoendopeptidase F
MATVSRTDFSALPPTAAHSLDWGWDAYSPYYADLLARELTEASVDQWLRDLSRVGNLVSEQGTRLQNDYSHDTRVAAALARLERYQQELQPQLIVTAQQIKEKLLASGLEPEGMAYPLRKLRAEAERFREANVALGTREQQHINEYNRLTGSMTAEFEGREVTLAELRAVQEDADRSRREAAWRLAQARMRQDREALNALWTRLVDLRGEMAANADCADYIEYLWPLKHRFDYTPDDARTFHASIAEAVVPALARLHRQRAASLGLDRLRPWDLACDPQARPPLRPFTDAAVLEEKGERIFHSLDPQLGAWFTRLRDGQLDLPNAPGKAPGGWCSDYAAARVPHIFMNTVGTHDDVNTLFHEAGHAFHGFSTYDLPYSLQRRAYMEFNEVASMAMELLATPYLEESRGGFYSPADAARAQLDHLEHVLYIWAMVAAGDAFQHWIYTHPDEARNASACADKYAELWQRYFPAVDYGGLEDELAWGWQRVLHFYVVPLYYIEYGLAQLGAVQVWMNSRRDPQAALEAYKAALRLGGTVSLPALYETAGARLSFDADSYSQAVAAMEARMVELKGQ